MVEQTGFQFLIGRLATGVGDCGGAEPGFQFLIGELYTGRRAKDDEAQFQFLIGRLATILHCLGYPSFIVSIPHR